MHWRLWAITFILFLTILSTVHAAAIGVSRATIAFENVLRNGYAEDGFYVSTDIKDNVSLVYEFEGPFKDWMSVKEGRNLTMNKEKGQYITVVVTPPVDTPNGIYDGIMRVTTGPLQQSFEGRIGSNVLAAFAVQVRVVVTGTEIKTCVPGGYGIADSEVGSPIDLRVSVTNGGNVRITPSIRLKIYDQSDKELIDDETVPLTGEILPTTTRQFTAQIQNLSLPLGQYFVSASIEPCQAEPQRLTFSILEKGQVSDLGYFLRIENPYQVVVNDIVPIDAFFMNVGNRTVAAKFKGTITSGKAVVKVIDTDTVNVLPLETAKIEAFFQPEQPGTYEIQGRILYNSKLTFEQGSVLNVIESRTAGAEERKRERINLLSFTPLIILLILILIFIVLIKRKMRQDRRKIVE